MISDESMMGVILRCILLAKKPNCWTVPHSKASRESAIGSNDTTIGKAVQHGRIRYRREGSPN